MNLFERALIDGVIFDVAGHLQLCEETEDVAQICYYFFAVNWKWSLWLHNDNEICVYITYILY